METFEFDTTDDGGDSTYEARVRALDGGEAIVIVRDVTSRKQLESAIVGVAEEWRQTFDVIDAGVIILDAAGSIRRVNRAALASLAGDFRDWVDRPATALRDAQPWNQGLDMARSLRLGETATRQVTDSASNRTWDLWCTRNDLAGGGTIIVARDISTLTRLQASMHRSQSMVMMGSLLAGVAHEVRNPLFAISAILDAFAVRGRDADPGRYLPLLQREVQRLRLLMTDLLEYGRPFNEELRPASVDTVIRESVVSCEAVTQQRGVRIAVRSRARSMVKMDVQRLGRVFVNLLENACQHSPPGSTVTIDAETTYTGQEPAVTIEVHDAGTGFVEQDLRRVFTPFFTRRAGGTGLGLAIAHQIVEEHHGRIEASNHPGGGALIRIALPVASQQTSVERVVA